jgi:hypothetical protein
MDSVMIRLAALGGLLFSLLAPVAAQERLASVGLKDGRVLEGRVLSMNLKVLKIEVGNKVLKVPTSLIRNCQLQEPIDSVTQAPRESASVGQPDVRKNAAHLGKEATARSQQPAPSPGVESAPAVNKAAVVGSKDLHITWAGPLADPVDERRYHMHRRIGLLDRAYPWLAPAAPNQWISLGAMLLVGLGLMVHLSVHVAGGEKAQVGRSMGFGFWYLVSGLAQVAMVPVNDPSIVLMIMLNSTLSLFGLVGLFGLPRIGAVVALMVQLGVVVLVFGILELVTALLGSVGVAP